MYRMYRRILRNKPFIILLIINIFCILWVVASTPSLRYGIKQEVKSFLVFWGVRKPQSHVKLRSRDIAFFFNLENAHNVYPVEVVDKISFRYLDDGKLIFRPGYYRWGNDLYDLNLEGLYYFIDFKNRVSRYAVVYRNDVISLLSSLSWLISHGNRDERIDYADKVHKLIHHKLFLTCWHTSRFVSRILRTHGIRNRIVKFLTLDRWNTYDNTHTLVEVKLSGEWVLFDVDNNRYFKIGNKRLAAKDFLRKDTVDKMGFVMLSKDSYCASFSEGNIDWVGLSDYINLYIKRWYKRVMQVPIIILNGKLFACSLAEKYRGRILKYYPSAIVLSKDMFIRKFYSKACR